MVRTPPLTIRNVFSGMPSVLVFRIHMVRSGATFWFLRSSTMHVGGGTAGLSGRFVDETTR
jgi:hypothetical protein